MNQKEKNPFLNLIKHCLIALTAFVAAAIFLLIVADKIVMPIYQKSGKEIKAPSLEGLSVPQAKEVVSSLRLFMVIDSLEYHPTYPENTVSFQLPAYNTVIKPGRRIHVKVSKGPKPLTVPNIVGRSQRDALLLIESQGLFVKEVISRASNDFPRGIVSGQSPLGDSEIPEKTGIIVYVSNGLKETNAVMPNLINLSLPAALDTLVERKFNLNKINIQEEVHEDLLPDTVIEQFPDPGTPVNNQNSVDIVVSAEKKEE